MQVRRIRRSIARGSDVPDDVAALHFHAFVNTVRIAIQVGIVITIMFGRIELIDCDPSWFAQEKFLDDAVIYSQDGGAARRENIGCFMLTLCSSDLVERIANIRDGYTLNRNYQTAR